jgi:hypothetical protein
LPAMTISACRSVFAVSVGASGASATDRAAGAGCWGLRHWPCDRCLANGDRSAKIPIRPSRAASSVSTRSHRRICVRAIRRVEVEVPRRTPRTRSTCSFSTPKLLRRPGRFSSVDECHGLRAGGLGAAPGGCRRRDRLTQSRPRRLSPP